MNAKTNYVKRRRHVALSLHQFPILEWNTLRDSEFYLSPLKNTIPKRIHLSSTTITMRKMFVSFKYATQKNDQHTICMRKKGIAFTSRVLNKHEKRVHNKVLKTNRANICAWIYDFWMNLHLGAQRKILNQLNLQCIWMCMCCNVYYIVCFLAAVYSFKHNKKHSITDILFSWVIQSSGVILFSFMNTFSRTLCNFVLVSMGAPLLLSMCKITIFIDF